jgi:hypothetical protein
MFEVIAQALKRAKPEPWKGNPSTYHAALYEWNTTVTIVANTLAEQCPEFRKEQFYFETTYWSRNDTW